MLESLLALRLKKRDLLHDQSGATAVILALCIVPILLVVGLALEGQRVFNTKAVLQSSIDATALNAAADLHAIGDFADVESTFDANVGGAGQYVTSHSITDDGQIVTGRVSAFVPAGLSGLIGRKGFTINVEAKAGLSAPEPRLACIITLDPDETNTLVLNGGAEINAPGCGIDVFSQADPAVSFNSGVDLNTTSTCIAGASVLDNSAMVPGVDYILNCTPAPDPISSILPDPGMPGCDHNAMVVTGTAILQPGVYCGGVNFHSNANIEFQPGLYIIRGGDWVVDGGRWRGTRVSFFFDDTSRIQFNSGVDARLEAPTSGPFERILFSERPGLPDSDFILNDTENFDITGLIYLPSRNFTVNGGGDVRTRDILLITRSLIFNAARWDFETGIAEQFAPPVASELALLE